MFDFNYMYTTNVSEPVRADEKHLGRVKRHFIKTDVQLSDDGLRVVSKCQPALKATRTGGGRCSKTSPGCASSSARSTATSRRRRRTSSTPREPFFPTRLDLMGLRWAQAVADVDSLRLQTEEFAARGRQRHLRDKVFDIASHNADTFLRRPEAERRPDL